LEDTLFLEAKGGGGHAKEEEQGGGGGISGHVFFTRESNDYCDELHELVLWDDNL